MSELLQRSLTGIVFVAALSAAFLLSQWSLAGLALIAAVIGIGEYHKMLTLAKVETSPLSLQIFLSIVLHVSITLASMGLIEGAYIFLALPVWGLFALRLVLRGKPKGIATLAYDLFAQIWITFPFALLSVLAFNEGYFNGAIVLGFFVILWINDTGAYLTGRLIGKHKLAPAISPGKTIEGFFGGVILAFITAWWMQEFTGALRRSDWMVIAAIIAVFSNAGDLLESVLKRSCGVKDSGRILPGHGGVLDRFDGILLSVPMVSAYLYLIKLS